MQTMYYIGLDTTLEQSSAPGAKEAPFVHVVAARKP
jgi:hypothetical protein